MTTRTRDIKILGFDVFGTVVDWRNSIARQSESFLKKYRIELDPFTFADEWRSRYQPSMEKIRSGERHWVPLNVLNRESLEEVLKGHGVDVHTIPDTELLALNRAWDHLEPWPDVREGLARLKRRYPIVTISNGHVSGMIALARHAGLPWDAILGAEVSQKYKPQPQVYLTSAKLAGVLPQQLAMVAAHNDDLAAARSNGLITIFVRRPLEWGNSQTADLAPDEEWDVLAESLVDLADILNCPR